MHSLTDVSDTSVCSNVSNREESPKATTKNSYNWKNEVCEAQYYVHGWM